MEIFDPKSVPGLNAEAFDRWLAYKKSRKQSYKTVASTRMAAVKLSQMGEDQEAVVDESISNNWAGLFPLKKVLQPGEKPKKTKQQVEADNVRDEWMQSQALKSAQAIAQTPIGALRMLDAVYARLLFQQEEPSFPERLEAFRDRVASALAAAPAKDAAGDPHILTMVRGLWGERGVNRLRDRAAKA